MKKQTLRIAGLLAIACLAVWLVTLWRSDPLAGDWPQWRYDAGRGASSPRELPEQLHLQWVRQLPEPRPAWPPSQPALRFDLSYSPVAAGETLLVPSMVTDSLTAYDSETGAEKWRFYTDGPVRLAPVAHQGKVYFGSDDGYLYCVDAADGGLLWRFRGGPSDRKVLGNQRLISTWPIRGGPVLLDGTIYFTAGIWPFMGIFVHAVDAQTGEAVWTNSGEGSTYQIQPHDSPAFGGLVSRGHLAATEQGLIAPGGRTPPGCFDLRTGKLLSFNYAKQGGRSSHVTARGQWLFSAGDIIDVADGKRVGGWFPAVHDQQALYSMDGERIYAQSLESEDNLTTKRDRKGRIVKLPGRALKQLWKVTVDDAPQRLFLKAGSQFVAGDKGVVALIEVNPRKKAARVIWKDAFEGKPWTMLAADDKLFVVTVEGRIYCFGEKKGKPKTYGIAVAGKAAPQDHAASSPSTRWQRHADAILNVTHATEGYCVMLGLGTGGLAEALVRRSKLHLIAVDADAGKVDRFRRRMQQAGLYGTRVAAQVGDPLDYPWPPYLASLIVSEDSRAVRLERGEELIDGVFRPLRPYGGTACLPVAAEQLKDLVQTVGPANAQVKAAGKSWSLLIREGALPGAADWTHQYADAANSVVSQDELVRAPLGLLWFGNGPPNDEVLPRHGHGPSPQVAAGRLLIEGADMLRALDVYTGRLLWQKRLPGLGRFYSKTGHQPGAGEIGGNYVSLADAVYVVYGETILELDSASGELNKQFKLEAGPDGSRPNWGAIAAWDDLLIATSTPVKVTVAKAAAASAAGKASDPAGYQPVIEPNARWQYLAGRDPSGDWTAVGFDADDWKTGTAGFGYDDDDDQTVLSGMRDHYTRVYIRKSFDGELAAGAAMALRISYDDGFIAYLNGKEVARAGIKRGSGKDVSSVKSHEAKGHETFQIRDFRKLLQPGRNVIAVEGHNSRPDSSDFTLDPYLLIKPRRQPETIEKDPPPKPRLVADVFTPGRYSSASRRLVVFDRHCSEQLWDRRAKYGFRHNNIAVGSGKLFCIDGLSKTKLEALKRRGKGLGDYAPRLLALDVRTGREIWSTGEEVFGTFLNYSAEYDVLLQAGSSHRDRADDETEAGMVAYRGADGEVIWKDLKRKHSGPCLLHGEMMIAQGPAYSLLTGKRKMRPHPLSGRPMKWEYRRNYGCNTAVAGRHLITFRSAAAGFYDLASDGGTGNFGGFKSGCTSNLIPAGGLLNAPEYTRTCTCNYQNQTSLALVHDPEVEIWTFNPFAWDGRPVRRVGINFGAPGDRLAEGGTLWLDYPSRGGPSPDIPVELKPDEPDCFCDHSSRIRADADRGQLNWVAASGIREVDRVTLTLAAEDEEPRNYTVRLHFAEVDDMEAGRRVFDIWLQGRRVLEEFDVVAQAGGRHRAVVREFRGIEVADQLQVRLVPRTRTSLPPVLCGIEVVAEGW